MEPTRSQAFKATLRRRGAARQGTAIGATRGGIPFGRGTLFHLLRNRFYIGEVKYKGEILPGEQPAIMDRALFDAVQQKLTDQWSHRTPELIAQHFAGLHKAQPLQNSNIYLRAWIRRS